MSPGHNDPLQNFHSKNVNCDQINFSDAAFSADRIRELSHCLNADHQIDALDQLISALPDSDVQPLADYLNEVITRQPKYLFALKVTYDRAKASGDLNDFEQTVSTLLASSDQNAAILPVLKKVINPLSQLVLDRDLQASATSAYVIFNAKSFQRLGAENFENSNLNTFLTAASRYVNSADAKPLRKIYGYIANNNLDTIWANKIAIDEQIHVQNIAHFFNWLASDGHYAFLSDSVKKLITKPVVCFDGGKVVPDPLASVTPRLATLNTKDAITYFTHDIKNLYLTAQSYCQYPYSPAAAIKFIDDATKVPGFDETWSLVRPILADKDFIDFIGTAGSANFMNDLQPLLGTHFFEDFFTLITLHLQNPITNDGNKVANFLDDSFHHLSGPDFKTTLNFLAPLLNAKQGYGATFLKTLYQIGYGFPSLVPILSDSLRSSLGVAAQDLVARPELPAVLDLTVKLIHDSTLNGLIDQALTYLQDAFDRGKFAYQPESPTDPKNFSLPSSSYLIAKFTATPPPPTVCDNMAYDFVFDQYSSANSAAYLNEISAIQACIDPNQTFAAAKDLITYSISTGSYNFVLSAQKAVLNTIFKDDSNLTFATLHDFLAVNQADSTNIRNVLNLSSNALGLVKSSYLSKSDLRKTVADVINSPTTYLAAAELTGDTPDRLRSSAPSLDLVNLKTVNAFISKEKRLTEAPVTDALAAMMKEYCPTLSNSDPDCAIDADQVTLYKQSPMQLFQQIAREELNASQSFLHPVLNKGWDHQAKSPTQVSDLEYHLNPTMHLLYQQMQTPQAILTALSRATNDGISLNQFLTDRAPRMLLVPYIYEDPGFPGQSAREYHDHVRIRILNDLDRLELIAINADFKAFGIVTNLGMGFLKEIALAWGDVPESQRPLSLNKFVAPANVRTLKEVKVNIEAELAKFDSNLLAQLGSCDPNVHRPLTRWFIRGACTQLGDVAARVFNLRSLVTLLQDELPIADGGRGGLIFLRDLFYSLYEANTDAQRNNYVDGELVGTNCLENPLSFNQPMPACQKDLLTLVSRVCHLGLLHEAGISIVNAQDNAIPAITSIIDRVVVNPDLTKQFVSALSSAQGLQFLSDTVDYGFQSPDGTGKNLSLVAQLLSIPKDLTWVNLAFELLPKDPHFPAENQALINSLLSIDSQSLKPWLDHWVSDNTLPTPQFLTYFSKELTPAVRNDLLTLLVELRPNSDAFAKDITTAKNFPALSTYALKKDAHVWAQEFATPPFASTRSNLSEWTTTAGFNQFCDVYSDSAWVTKAYNFLESVNQNPDAKTFLQSSEDFINVH